MFDDSPRIITVKPTNPDYLLILDEVERRRCEIRERERRIVEAENCIMAMVAMMLGTVLLMGVIR